MLAQIPAIPEPGSTVAQVASYFPPPGVLFQPRSPVATRPNLSETGAILARVRTSDCTIPRESLCETIGNDFQLMLNRSCMQAGNVFYNEQYSDEYLGE